MSRIDLCTFDTIRGAHDILINCTPVGMYPRVDASPVDCDVVSRCAAVFDAVYNPRETCLLRLARERGIRCVEGLGMLFYQAVEAQKIWLGEKNIASQEQQKSVYLELLSRM